MEYEKPVLLKVLTLTGTLRQLDFKQKSRVDPVLNVITKPGKNRKIF
jgi:hypothetical protein